MKAQLSGFEMISGQIHIHYDYYAASVTKKRAPDLDNFVGAAKNLVGHLFMVKLWFHKLYAFYHDNFE